MSPPPTATTLQSVAFRREREAAWLELAALVARVERGGPSALAPGELRRLPVLYRAALSSLSVARAISLDKSLLDFLEALAARAWTVVYGARGGFRSAIAQFLTQTFPRAVRAAGGRIALSSALMLLGAAVGFAMTMHDMENFYTVIPAGLAGGRDPTASTEDLRRTLFDRSESGTWLLTFASALFSHNAMVGILGFTVGIVGGVLTALMVFLNGLMLGAFAALFHSRGLAVEMWGWVLPHGVTELFAIVLCCAGGFAIGGAALFPGTRTRRESLAVAGKHGAILAAGAALLFLVAGLIEGVFRQTVLSTPLRYAVAIAIVPLWLAYFLRCGRRA